MYTLREAAGYLRVPKSTLQTWARPQRGSPLITVFPRAGQQATMPFIGFAQAYAVATLRCAGVPLRRIRQGVEIVRNDVEYALASRRCFTVLSCDGIEYGRDGWASEIALPGYTDSHVIVNPEVAFGLPIVAGAGARVEDLVDPFLAGDTLTDIADDFDMTSREVEDVIRVATRTAA